MDAQRKSLIMVVLLESCAAIMRSAAGNRNG
jgi:hypothetical protein